MDTYTGIVNKCAIYTIDNSVQKSRLLYYADT